MHFIKLRKVCQPSKTIVAKHCIIFRYTVHRRPKVHSQIATLGSICALLPPHRIFTGAWHQAKVWSQNRYICKTELWHLNKVNHQKQMDDLHYWTECYILGVPLLTSQEEVKMGQSTGQRGRPQGWMGEAGEDAQSLCQASHPPRQPTPALGQMVNELANGANSCKTNLPT